jgi:hypothetical protein
MYRKIPFNNYILKYIPTNNQINFFNKINGLINYKINMNKLHMTLMYIKMNKKIMKSLLNKKKIESFAIREMRNVILMPENPDKVINTLTDVFGIIYKSNMSFNNAINNIRNFLIKEIIRKLRKYKYTTKYKCEKDGGVWFYIDIVKNEKIISILKIRSDQLLPHISWSMYSNFKKNPINVYDIRKLYRNRELKEEISKSKLKMKQGFIEFT